MPNLAPDNQGRLRAEVLARLQLHKGRVLLRREQQGLGVGLVRGRRLDLGQGTRGGSEQAI